MSAEHFPAAATLGDERGLSLWRGLRVAASALSDDFVAYVGGNVAWLVSVGLAVLAGRVFIPGYIVLLIVVPGSFGLCRMAAIAVRGNHARLSQFRAGVSARGWTGVGIGSMQLLLLVLAGANVTIAWQAPSLPLVASATASLWVGIFVAASVLVVWPLLHDPDREQLSVTSILLLALVIIAARPGRLFALVVVEALLITVGLQTFVAALVLPALGLLLASWVVIPLADELTGSRTVRPGTPR
jgi:hypothetical protein